MVIFGPNLGTGPERTVLLQVLIRKDARSQWAGPFPKSQSNPWMVSRVKIAAISYLNTLPFVYGIRHANHNDLQAELLLNVPSSCCSLLNNGDTDIALIPVADLPRALGCRIITPYCIGAETDVRTVVLLSNVPLSEIETVYLDSHSATSVQLIRILAEQKWHIRPQWRQLTDYSTVHTGNERNGYLLIGDKVFDYEYLFRHKADLSTEWHELTGLPFVFAVWVAKNNVSEQTVKLFGDRLTYGLAHRSEAIRESRYAPDYSRSLDYLTRNIKYELDTDKIKAITLFLHSLGLHAEGATPD